MAMPSAQQNTWIDWILRGQTAPTLPGSWYAALMSAVPGPGLPNGTEITAGGVTRQALSRALATWSGTQGAGSTSASSGTSGTSSNNADIEFAAAASGTISGAIAVGLFDASSSGNCWLYGLITASGTPVVRTWAPGDPVIINAGDLQFVMGG